MVTQESSLTSELAHFIVGIDFDSLPESVVRRAKDAIIDGTCVVISGYHSDCATLVRRYISSLGLHGNAAVIGEGETLPAEYAALANGVAGHCLCWRGVHLQGYSGAPHDP